MQSNPSERTSSEKILIIGAGPTGLGAAHRLEQLGHSDYLILEKDGQAGGLASSFTDPNGFVWDVGGHVQFSHYQYFDDLMEKALGDKWLEHLRESYVWIYNRFVPYPFQNNLRYLPRDVTAECILELIREEKREGKKPEHFKDWIQASFGTGIAKHFMYPYNFKVWAYPLNMLSYSWIGERVARVNVEKCLENILLEKDDVNWGPNSKFRFPLKGGTGVIWRSLAHQLPHDKLIYNSEVVTLDPHSRTLTTSTGREYAYHSLISSIPLDCLARLIKAPELIEATNRLLHSTVHIIGIGFKGAPSEALKRKCWMYFPENMSPFYRVTLFSNYSYNNVPDPTRYWSLMAEVSESPYKPVNHDKLVIDTLQGMYASKLASPADEVVSTWSFTAPYGYPTPSVDRDNILNFVQAKMEEWAIYSRGRFGGWKYEVSNQDHSCMQGVEAVNRILFGVPEITYLTPALVNGRKNQLPREESMRTSMDR